MEDLKIPEMKLVDSTPELKLADSTIPLKLDLACGQTPKEGFKGVDWWFKGADYCFDLQQYPWPFEDNSVSEIYCSHYIEHIPMEYVDQGGAKKDALFAFFDECYRILKPDGLVTIITPSARSNRGFQDPTHRRFIVSETFLYFSDEWRKINKLDHYAANCNFGISVSHSMSSEMSLLHPEAQTRRFNESWNVVYDWLATLKSMKPKT